LSIPVNIKSRKKEALLSKLNRLPDIRSLQLPSINQKKKIHKRLQEIGSIDGTPIDPRLRIAGEGAVRRNEAIATGVDASDV